MEKLIYFLRRRADTTVDDLRLALLGPLVNELRAFGARNITVTVADLNEQVEAANTGRLIGPWQDVHATVALWLECLDQRAPVESALRDISAAMDGYLVTESVLQNFEPDWEGGERRPGVTQIGANGKPAHVSDADFYYSWQVLHSASSFELHPYRWSYVRNAVARPLTEDAPTYRAIVSEHFHTLEDFTDDSRYFGSPEAVQAMIEECAQFCDFENMFSLGMSEYFFA